MALFGFFSGKQKTPHQLLADGKLKPALKGFLELHQAKPDEPIFMVQIAEIYKKLKEPDQALPYYIKVGNHFINKGFINKAVASFKKALNIHPDNEEVLEKLKELNEEASRFMLNDSFFARKNLDDSEDDELFDITQEEVSLAEESLKMELEQASSEIENFSLKTLPEFGLEGVKEQLSEAVRIRADKDRAAQEAIEKEDVSPDEVTDAESLSLAHDEHAPEDSDDEPFETTGEDEELLGDEPFSEAEFDASSDEALEEESGQDPKSPTTSTPGESPLAPTQEAPQTVFKNRETVPKQPTASTSDQVSSDFESVDDALDAVFSFGPVGPGPAGRAIMNNPDKWALFQGMDTETFTDIVMALETRAFEPGDFIIRQGEEGSEMFLIVEGEVEVTIQTDQTHQKVAKLKSGDFFGEGAILTKSKRNASIQALETTEVLALSKKEFVKLVKKHPNILNNMKLPFISRKKMNKHLLGSENE